MVDDIAELQSIQGTEVVAVNREDMADFAWSLMKKTQSFREIRQRAIGSLQDKGQQVEEGDVFKTKSPASYTLELADKLRNFIEISSEKGRMLHISKTDYLPAELNLIKGLAARVILSIKLSAGDFNESITKPENYNLKNKEIGIVSKSVSRWLGIEQGLIPVELGQTVTYDADRIRLFLLNLREGIATFDEQRQVNRSREISPEKVDPFVVEKVAREMGF